MCHFDSKTTASAASLLSSMPVPILLSLSLIQEKTLLSKGPEPDGQGLREKLASGISSEN